VLINPVAPNELGGLNLDFFGSYYAKGASYFDKDGAEHPWNSKEIVQCGSDSTHASPYSYGLPKGRPVKNPLCVPANPPAALARGIEQLKQRGIRAGISILGGGGDDNIPGIPTVNQLVRLTHLETTAFAHFLTQFRAAATVLHDWGIAHFDIDLEGGIASALNAQRLPEVLDALRFNDSIVSVTTEAYNFQYGGISSVLNSSSAPDLVQLMMGDYSETLQSGLQTAGDISKSTGYPLSKFRLGVKPQCGRSVGSATYLDDALPAVVESGAGVMLWNLGRDYPCEAQSCSDSCASNTLVGQAPFTVNSPFTWACSISKAWGHGMTPVSV
jgi:hypothetical protein